MNMNLGTQKELHSSRKSVYERPMVLDELFLRPLALLGTMSNLGLEIEDLDDLGEAP